MVKERGIVVKEAIRYDDKHFIVFARGPDMVPEGYSHRAWIELADGGIPTDSIFHGVAATPEQATEKAKEQAIFAITTGTVRYPEPKK
jgi:hypothetical protein